MSESKKYNVVYADPPWSYRSKSGRGFRHAAEHKYDVMTLDDIKAMPVADLCQKDAVLFLWTTVPMLPDALEVVKAWGFKYKTLITWRKVRSLGMGFWFRGQCEHLILGVRGGVKPFRSQKVNFHQSTVLEHSRKPDYFRKLIDDVVRVSFGEPVKLEMFARSADDMFPDHHLQGWDVFGNEVNNSIEIG